MHPNAVIVGGGIHGCSVALHLARRGWKVTVVEQDHVGRHASGVNAGSVHHIDRLAAELPLAALTLRMWPRIADLLDDDCGFRLVGRIKIAERPEELEAIRRSMAVVQAQSDIAEELLDQAQLREAEPEVSDSCLGAVFSPGCGYADPFRTMTAFRRKAGALGVVFHENEGVVSLARRAATWDVGTAARHLSTPVVVNCAGAWGSRVAAMAGESVALEPTGLMLSVSMRMPVTVRSVLGLTGRLLSVKQFPNGTIVIGGGYRGTVDLERRTAGLDLQRLRENLRAALDVLPVLAGATIVRCWAGIEGRTADGLPIIGESRTEPGLWHAFGFSSHGFFLGPTVGHTLAALIDSGAAGLSLDGFRIGRFAVPELAAAHGRRALSH